MGIDGDVQLSDDCDETSDDVEWIEVVVVLLSLQEASVVFLSFPKKVESNFCLYSSQNLAASLGGSAGPSSFG